MNPSERAIRYLELTLPEPGELTKIADGIHWIRMPLPFALDHINLWLLEDHFEGKAGWTVIDTGVANDQTKSIWQSIIHQKLGGRPIVRVLCTHFHPDHIGLADWLCSGAGHDKWLVPLWINYAEYTTAKLLIEAGVASADTVALPPDAAKAVNIANHFQRHGIRDPDTLEKLRARKNHYPSLVPCVPGSFRRIFPNEEISIGANSWRVIPGYGHSPEHCALYCAKANLLISGDMVLPKISTNMSVWAQEPDANPLRLYLDSLAAYAPLPDDVTVLPSHGNPFGAAKNSREGGITIRLAQLHAHHQERLAETLDACATPQSAAQIMPVLFKRQLDLHQLTFAIGETIAHLNYLWHAGRLDRTIENDQIRFVRVGS
jgi:glyoxylase-like metal-dependent hydrolase (beta-lactamase superfamily II)